MVNERKPKSKSKPKVVAPAKPKKSSYLPADWKEKQDRYGTITVRKFKTRYDGEPGDSVIDGPISTETTTFKIEKPTLKSEKTGL